MIHLFVCFASYSLIFWTVTKPTKKTVLKLSFVRNFLSLKNIQRNLSEQPDVRPIVDFKTKFSLLSADGLKENFTKCTLRLNLQLLFCP